MTGSSDTLYSDPIETITAFRFDDRVAEVFGDMIQRSVPGYRTVLGGIGYLAERFAQPQTYCYDLGCSLGAVAISMAANINKEKCCVLAVDNSLAMIHRCKTNLSAVDTKVPIQPICADIRDIKIENASIVALNYTLQFIEPKHRFQLLSEIYQGLQSGGILILSEKLRFEDPKQQMLHQQMHEAFKFGRGYSDLEISQKRTALENVLQADSVNFHRTRLAKVGFKSVEVWFQYFNFASMIAIK